MGHGVWFRRSLQRTLDRQLVIVNRKPRSDPERIDDVVPLRVYRIGMNEDAQATMVEHQPGYQRRASLAKAT